MLGGYDQNQVVLQVRIHGEFRERDGWADKAHVHHAGLHLTKHLFLVRDGKADLDPGILGFKLAQHVRDHVDPDRGSRADPEMPPDQTLQAIDCLPGLGQELKHPDGILLKNFPGFREGEKSSLPHEQGSSERLLDAMDLSGNRGLGEVKLPQCPGNSPEFRNRQEGTEIGEIHVHRRSPISDILPKRIYIIGNMHFQHNNISGT